MCHLSTLLCSDSLFLYFTLINSLPGGGSGCLPLSLQTRGQSGQYDGLESLKKSEDIREINDFLV